eukprot:363550-Chlamydomonas_euryale.AAC.3
MLPLLTSCELSTGSRPRASAIDSFFEQLGWCERLTQVSLRFLTPQHPKVALEVRQRPQQPAGLRAFFLFRSCNPPKRHVENTRDAVDFELGRPAAVDS